VAFSNVIYNCNKAISVYGGVNNVTNALAIWNATLDPGSTNAYVFEDNFVLWDTNHVFNNSAAGTAGGHSARRIVRHNTWQMLKPGLYTDIVDAHGNQARVDGQTLTNWAGDPSSIGQGGTNPPGVFHRGNRLFTFHNNTVHLEHGRHLSIRGGTALVYSNTFSGPASTAVYLWEEDGPNRFEWITNWPGMDKHNVYVWDNVDDGGTSYPFTSIESDSAVFIELGRDLFTNAPPGYVALEYPHPLRATLAPSPQFKTVNAGTANIGSINKAP
jgi:hypothetical protein